MRTARPGDSFGGMTLRDRIKAYKDVAAGDAVTIAKSRVKDTQGFKVAKKGLESSRVIIPVNKTAKISVEKGNIVIRHPGDAANVKRTMLPRKNLRQYLLNAESLPELKGNKWYAFYAYKGKSKRIFHNAEDLIEYLHKYRDDFDTDEDERDFFRTFEIVEISDRKQWEKREYKKSGSHGGRRKKMKDYPPSKQEQLRMKKREYMKKWRAKNKR